MDANVPNELVNNNEPIVPPQKPGTITAIAIMTLISGILNIIGGASATIAIVLGTLGIGLLCAPLTILPLILGIFEILYAVKILPDPIKAKKPSQTLAIIQIITILFGNVYTLVVGILALVFYGQDEVKNYFAWIETRNI
jgi:hypothetical protein